MSDGKEFLKEAKEVRNEFVKIAGQYSVSEHLELRTEIDTLLIMYDQACERVRVGSKPETNASTCNLQNVNNRFNWNHFFIGYGIGLLIAFIIWLTAF